MSAGLQTTLRGLVERHSAVHVPLIQRDYAQGRKDEVDIREEFLDALAAALLLPAGDQGLPLNLDFVYGSVEGEHSRAFHPLDGQQRLTTLFLLHWYCAWKDQALDEFQAAFCVPSPRLSRFGYQVRSSSNEFFNALVHYRPDPSPQDVDSLSELIMDQHWYVRSWKFDPTVQSTLVMLDAVHTKFRGHSKLFHRLMDTQSPAITFQLLDLDHFGLSDDLYIKMNARGKPLTAFENFKARFEHELAAHFPELTFTSGEQSFSAADYISRRMDTRWADLFWSMRDAKSDSYDAAMMNVIRAVALVTRRPDAPRFADDIDALRVASPTYSDFHARGWLDQSFTLSLVHLLDLWSSGGGRLKPIMASSTHFDERATFERLAKWTLTPSYTDVVQLAAYVALITDHQGRVDGLACERWMRIVANLSVNTGYNRVEDFRRSMGELRSLVRHADDIEGQLAKGAEVSGFNEQQVAEERVKANLLLADEAWRPLIDRAESHPYFRGQIEFLLAFAGVLEAVQEQDPAQWNAATHAEFQSRFQHHLAMAILMFGANGLKALPEARWERALLTLGDYLFAHGIRNLTFGTNPITEPGSWKRYLRGGSAEYAAKRDLLRQLWSRLDPAKALEPQLDAVIVAAGPLDFWRAALVRWPETIMYCEDRRVRKEDGCFYLLKRTQRNGAHKELTSYALLLRSLERKDLPNLSLGYEPSIDSTEPFIRIGAKVLGVPIRMIAFYFGTMQGSISDWEKLQDNVALRTTLTTVGIDPAGKVKVTLADFHEWLTRLNGISIRAQP